MPSVDVRKLRATLERLESDAARLTQEAEQAIREAQSFRGVLAYYEQHPDELETAPTSGRGSGKILNDATVAVLEQQGKPTHYKELRRLVEGRGIKVPGQDPDKNIGAHMSQDSRCESLGNGMWGLKVWRKPSPMGTGTERPSPESNGQYHPILRPVS